ncbi:aldehyde dehydrogenase family protein [Pseudoteredinibacter isoporae]|uniref:aldehyde dehydrogenase family protein n=1 Tax=Pseudoteredinibacter isoporae TaxID=570281 RepID=UPI0031098D47
MDKQHSVTAPYSGEVLGDVPLHNADQIEQMLSEAYGLFRDRNSWLPLHERVAILERLVELMVEQRDTLAMQAAKEGGKPLQDSLVEVDRGIDGVRLAIECIRSEAGEVIPTGGTAGSANRMAFTQKEPIGVVVAVSAFNHPLNLIVHQVVPAVAVGCPVIVKPSLDTPLSCRSLVELLHKAGLPEPWCRTVSPQETRLTEALVTDPRTSFFSFIGSARVGWMLRSKLAPGTRCALEHGGVAPLIVAKDADLERAVAAVAKGGFYHAGQVCVSVQRVFVHTAIVEEFNQRLVAATRSLAVGDPADIATEVGPLIRPVEVERVADWVNEATGEEGGELLCGGKQLPNNCYEPTVIFNPPEDAKLSQQEVFGPVVCVYSYDDLQTAIDQANALPVAFQAAVFTESINTAMKVYRNIDASAVMLNDHTAFRVDGMPFAGLRQSGLGVGGIPHTIEDMQIEKMLVMHEPR